MDNRLVTIKNGYYAVGKNELVQEIINTGNVPGFLAEPVLKANMLPRVATGGELLPSGTVGIVFGNPSERSNGLYQYIGMLSENDGLEVLIDEWVEPWFYARTPKIYNDSVVNAPAFFDVLQGDDVAVVTSAARNFAPSTTGTSTITDVNVGTPAAAIRLTGQTDSHSAMLTFANVTANTGRPSLTILRALASNNSPAAAEGMAAVYSSNDEFTLVRQTWNLANTDTIAYYSDAAPIGQRGHGSMKAPLYAGLSPMPRVDNYGQFGSDPLAPVLASGRQSMQVFAEGYWPGESDVSMTYDQADAGTPGAFFEFESTCGPAVNVTVFDLQKFVALTTRW